MAILDASFVTDFQQIKADDGAFSPIPAGDYTVQVTGSELKSTKDGTGQYLKVTFDVLGPAYQGRKLFQNYNIFNKSANAERIGRSQLKALTTAIGLDTLRDTDEIIGCRVLVHVSIESDKTGRYSDQNRVSKYRPAELTGPMPVMAGPHATTGGYTPMSAPSPTAEAEDGSFASAFAQPAPTIPATNGFDFR